MLDRTKTMTLSKLGAPFRAPGFGTDDETIVVVSGLIGLFLTDVFGSRRIIGLRFPGEAVLPGARGGAGIVALVRDTQIYLSQPHNFTGHDQQRRADTTITQQWLGMTSWPKTERTAHLICEALVRGEFGDTLPPLFTQQVMGELTGQTCINVCRVLADLDRLGLIKRDRKKEIHVPDFDALAKFGAFNPEYLQRNDR